MRKGGLAWPTATSARDVVKVRSALPRWAGLGLRRATPPRPPLRLRGASDAGPSPASSHRDRGPGGGAWAQDGRRAPGGPESKLSGPGAAILGDAGPGAGGEGASAGDSRREEVSGQGAGLGRSLAGLGGGGI